MQNRSGLPIVLERKKLPEAFPLEAMRYTQQYQSAASLHYHDCLEIGRCVDGNGLLFAGGSVHPFKTDSVYVIPGGCVHDSRIIMDSPNEKPSVWQYLFIDASQLGIPFNGFSMLDHKLLPLFEWMFELASQQPAQWQMEIQHLLQALAIEVNRTVSSQAAVSTDPMLLIQHKIAAEYDSALTVEGLARECSLSVSAFRKRFTACAGMSPQQYIIQTKLQIARHLILHTDEKLIVIAHKAGFRTLSSFNRLFLRRYGCAPRDLRKNANQKTSL